MSRSILSTLQRLESCIGRLEGKGVGSVQLGVRARATVDEDEIDNVVETYAEDALFALLKEIVINIPDETACKSKLQENFEGFKRALHPHSPIYYEYLYHKISDDPTLGPRKVRIEAVLFWSLAREIITAGSHIVSHRPSDRGVVYTRLVNYIRDTTNHEMRAGLFHALQAEKNGGNEDLMNAIFRAFGAYFTPTG